MILVGFIIAVLALMVFNVSATVFMLLKLKQLEDAAYLSSRVQEQIQSAARIVAADLAQRYVRADAVQGLPGEAADVAAQSDPDA